MKKIVWSVLAGFILAGVPHAEQIDEIYFNPSPVGKYTNLNLTERLETQNLRVNSGDPDEPAQMDINQTATVSYSAANIQTLTLKPHGTAVVPNGTIVKLQSVPSSSYMPLSAVGNNTLEANGKTITVAGGSNVQDSTGVRISAMRLGNVSFSLPNKDLKWDSLTDDSNHTWQVLGYDETSVTPPEPEKHCVAKVIAYTKYGNLSVAETNTHDTCAHLNGNSWDVREYAAGETIEVNLSQAQCTDYCELAIYRGPAVQGGEYVVPVGSYDTFAPSDWVANSINRTSQSAPTINDLVNLGAAGAANCGTGESCPEIPGQSVYFKIPSHYAGTWTPQLTNLTSCKGFGTHNTWSTFKNAIDMNELPLHACIQERAVAAHGQGILNKTCYLTRGAYGRKSTGAGANEQWYQHSPFVAALHCYEAYAPVRILTVQLSWQ